MEAADECILRQLKHINRDAGAFATGILTDELSQDEQICFAHRLVDLAEAIRDRTIRGQVIKGSVIDVNLPRALPPAVNDS